MLDSWVASALVFVAPLHSRFAFATEEECRAVARGKGRVSLGQESYAGFARRARVATDYLELTLLCSMSTAFTWALPKPS